MADPVTAAKVAYTALNALVKKNADGQSGLSKLLIAVAIILLTLLMIMTVAVEIFLMPLDNILPDSLSITKKVLSGEFSRPIIQTGQQGIIALPTRLSTVSSHYGWRTLYNKSNWHEGIDFPVPMYSEVMSVEKGIIVDTGFNSSYGTYITIKHTMEYTDPETDESEIEVFYSFYAHLFSAYVFVGQNIEKHQNVALSGGDKKIHLAGNSTGAHLHLELRHSIAYGSEFDPYELILKPIGSKERENYKFL